MGQEDNSILDVICSNFHFGDCQLVTGALHNDSCIFTSRIINNKGSCCTRLLWIFVNPGETHSFLVVEGLCPVA